MKIKMKVLLVFVVTMVLSISQQAQLEGGCAVIDGPGCTYEPDVMAMYAPDNYSPILTINLNFHFVEDMEGEPGNFNLENDGI
ncbi:MAG: hypothetical protein SH856_06915 [Flavobacteriales bacterium]|nr:hypothetical protein [Flavobacteriales bacterium]